MSPWVLRGLREGVVTTRWPARPDAYADDWRAPATVLGPRPARAADLPSLCPTGAISSPSGRDIVLDQGRCVLCGQCVRLRPDIFGWTRGTASSALSRTALLAAIRAALSARTRVLKRSVHLRHVDAGSDGSEEQEIAALLNPIYDVGRLGIFFTASPRHADVLLVTGAGAHGMAQPLRRTYDGMPDPMIVIAVGTDAISGGMLAGIAGGERAGSYATSGGIAAVVPVDVWVPGSPPPPFAILHGLLLGLGRLPQPTDPRGTPR